MSSVNDFFPLFDKSEDDIYAEMAATANLGVLPDDPDWVDTRVGSPFFYGNYPAAVQLASAYSRMNEAAAAGILATSWGGYLDLWAESFGEERVAATAATGAIRFIGAAGALVGTGARVSVPQTDPSVDPPVFQTVESGVVAVTGPPTGLAATGSTSGGTLAAATYHYVITTVDALGQESLPSAEVTVTTTGSTGSVALGWGAAPHAVAYKVYRATAVGPPWGLVATVTSPAYPDAGAAASGSLHPPTVAPPVAFADLSAQALDEGAAGNVAAGRVIDLQTGVSGVSSVTNPSAMTGGAEVESDGALKTRLEGKIGGDKGGNVAWYVARALEQPGVGRVTVVPQWAGGGTMLVILMDSGGRAVPTAVVTALQQRLDPVSGQGAGLAPADHAVTVATPAEIKINVKGTPVFKPGYNLDGSGGLIGIGPQLQDAIVAYVGSLQSGDDVVYDAVKAAYFTVPGLLDVTGVQIQVDAGSWVTTDIAISTNPAQVAVPNTVSFV